MEASNFLLFFSLLGFVFLLKLSLPLLHWLYAAFLRPGKDLKRVYGPWAVVTGATDGIGRAMALELARQGMHLVLVGRSPGKLEKTTNRILRECGETKVKTVVWDLADCGCDGAEKLRQVIDGMDVGVLLNCAGATYPSAAYFHEVEERVWRDVVKVNVDGTSHVTQVVLPGMVTRRRGAVVNVGSASSVALPSFPLFAVYAATKAYINNFSRSLHIEYKGMGINVQCQIPFYVATKMVSIEKSSTFVPSPDTFAKAAVRCIGYESLCTPYWSHAIEWGFASLLPDAILDQWRYRLGMKKRIQATKTVL